MDSFADLPVPTSARQRKKSMTNHPDKTRTCFIRIIVGICCFNCLMYLPKDVPYPDTIGRAFSPTTIQDDSDVPPVIDFSGRYRTRTYNFRLVRAALLPIELIDRRYL